MDAKFRSVLNYCDLFLEGNNLLVFHCANGIYIAENYIRMIEHEINDYPFLVLENVSLAIYGSNKITYTTNVFNIAIDQIVGVTAMTKELFASIYK